MPEITEITERLASSVVLADPADLPALAEIHEHLRQLGKAAQSWAQVDESMRARLAATAGEGEKLVEQIILREVSNAEQALQRVGDTINAIQQLVSGNAPDIDLPPASPAAAEPAPATAPGADATPQPVAPKAAAPTPIAEDTINPDDLPMVQEFIGEAMSHIETAEAAVLKIEENPLDLDPVNAVFRSFHTIKGVAGFLNLKRIGALAHAAENLLDRARHGDLKLQGPCVDVVLESIDMMKRFIDALKQSAATGVASPAEPGLAPLVERLNAAASGQAQPAAATTAAPDSSAAASAAPKPAAGNSNAAADATVKVATDRLDSLINMVGELVIAQSMVSQDLVINARGNHRLERNVSHLSKITRELQDLSMSMRMVPIHGVFQKMARLVRDLARKNNKEIDFVVTGGETELDRNVVEAISDPLVHMVRNAADHGIETPDDRREAGKPTQGRLTLNARHQAGNIVIEISDDGRGLNKKRILNKAIAAGLIREGQQLSDQEIFKLIFAPGLSTAEKITDVSGRGVGMDVVKKNVESLRGRIDITSAEGKGSTFTIRLPLTLAVIDGQIVQVGQQRFIIPITSIEQSIQPKAEQLKTVQNRGEMCLVRGSLIPMFRLHRLFNVTPRTEDPTKSLVIIVQDDTRRCCLLVDDLLGQQQVVIKTLGDSLGQIPGISGGAILGDGNVSLILDIPGLLGMATQN